MKRVIVQYKVKPDHVAMNLELVRRVYEELHRSNPAGLRYATFQQEDGLSFLHLAISEDEGAGPLPGLAAFKKFHTGLAERCDEAPQVARLLEVGAFRL